MGGDTLSRRISNHQLVTSVTKMKEHEAFTTNEAFDETGDEIFNNRGIGTALTHYSTTTQIKHGVRVRVVGTHIRVNTKMVKMNSYAWNSVSKNGGVELDDLIACIKTLPTKFTAREAKQLSDVFRKRGVWHTLNRLIRVGGVYGGIQIRNAGKQLVEYESISKRGYKNTTRGVVIEYEWNYSDTHSVM